MKLSLFGRLQMNNPARALAQRRYTARRMRELGGTVDHGTVLEIGCGRGVGIDVILATFHARRVVAFDLDPKMVELAQRRLASRNGNISLAVASATAIPARDATYDAVFDFGVIHQIEAWRSAVAECARVLKPGGRFYFEAVAGAIFRRPMNLAMARGTPDVRKIGFDRDAYLAALEEHGIRVGTNFLRPRNPITGALIGDLIGVGKRAL